MIFRRRFPLFSAADAVFGTGGAGAPAPAPAPAPAGAPAPAPAPGGGDGGGAWYDGIQNAELKTWISAKGFKDGSAAAESAWNLEKLIGHDKAGRTVVLPKDDATAEEVQAYHAKIGVPAKAEDYKLPVPEGQDAAFAQQAAAWMHEAGVPAKAGAKLAEKWNTFVAEQAKAQQDAAVKQSATDLTEVMTEWGQKAEANLQAVQRAAAEFIPAKDGAERKAIFSKIEMAVGTKVAMAMFQRMGEGMGEHRAGGEGGGGSGGGMTATQAQAQITALKADKAWASRYIAGGAAEKAEMDRLHKIAYPAVQ